MWPLLAIGLPSAFLQWPLTVKPDKQGRQYVPFICLFLYDIYDEATLANHFLNKESTGEHDS
jgi:hypothetical protein